jgi:hypothetical protein
MEFALGETTRSFAIEVRMPKARSWLSLIFLINAACSGASFQSDSLGIRGKANTDIQSSETSITTPESDQTPVVVVPENTSGSYLTCALAAGSEPHIRCGFAEDVKPQLARRQIVEVQLILEGLQTHSPASHSSEVQTDGSLSIEVNPDISGLVRLVVLAVAAEDGSHIRRFVAKLPGTLGPGIDPDDVMDVVEEAMPIHSRVPKHWDINFSSSKQNDSLANFNFNFEDWRLVGNWMLGEDDSDDNDSRKQSGPGYLPLYGDRKLSTRNHWPGSADYCTSAGSLRSDVNWTSAKGAYDGYAFNLPIKLHVELGLIDRQLSDDDSSTCSSDSLESKRRCAMYVEHIMDVSSEGSNVSAMRLRFGVRWGGSSAQEVYVFAARSSINGGWITVFDIEMNAADFAANPLVRFEVDTLPDQNKVLIKVPKAGNHEMSYPSSELGPLEGSDRCRIETTVQAGEDAVGALRRIRIDSKTPPAK